jgi:diguanylate cyclase (GGDEF)-like protein
MEPAAGRDKEMAIFIPSTANRSAFRRLLPLVFAAVIGVAITLSVFFLIRNGENARLVADFQGLAADRAQAIRAGLSEEGVELNILGSYVAAATELAEGRIGFFAQEFARMTRRIPVSEPDSQLFFFIPRVTAAKLVDFEAQVKRELLSTFIVREPSDRGDLGPVGKRAEYYPILVVEPSEYHEAMVGFDLSSLNSFRAAISRAITSGKTTIMERSGLPGTPAEPQYVWHFLDVTRTATVPGTKTIQGESIGIVASAFRIDQLVESVLKNLSPAGIDLELSDPEAPPDLRIVYYHKSRIPGYEATSVQRTGMSWSATIDAGNRSWTLRAFPTREFLLRHGSWQSWIILICGALLSIIACYFFAGRLRRTARVEALVTARTRELATEVAKQEDLAKELADSRSTLTGQVERLNQRTHEIQLLNELGDTLQVCVSTEEAFPVISLYVPRLLPQSSGALYMHDPARDMYARASVWGDAPPSNPAFLAEDCWALRRGKTHVVSASTVMLPCRHEPDAKERGALCIPITASGKIISLFHVTHSPEEMHAFAVSVADRIGLALSNLMLRSDLLQLSIHDPLTGLYNRRYMEETLELETRRAVRKEKSIGVLMLDIDHFKTFNDRFGHAAGDELLKALASLTLANLRSGDIACRFGGEEFLLILPEASAEVALRRAEDLREHVQKLEVRHGDQILGPITISIGVAVFPENGRTREQLLGAADAALYKAKKAGRNCVVAADGESSVPAP